MNRILIQLLPEGYKKAKYQKQGYEIEENGIYAVLEMRKFYPFVDDKNAWFLSIGIDIRSNYCPFEDFIEHIIFNISLINNEIRFTEGVMSQVTYFKTEDKDKLAKKLDEVVIPWVNKIRQPENLIEFLERSRLIGLDDKEDEHVAAFGDAILFFKYWNQLQRKRYLGILATLYEKTEQYDKALSCMKDYRPFLEEGTKRKNLDDVKKANLALLSKIDDTIEKYSQL